MRQKRSPEPSGGPEGAPRFVAYYRVSTAQQGASGLGIEAQKAAVAKHVAQLGGAVIHEFEEAESGKRSDRPQLAAALDACRRHKATLIVAKLDRLARNVRFLLTVAEGVGDAGVVFCDLPALPPGPVGKFLLTLLAAVAELEAGLISQRTKAALAAARERGKRLGNPNLKATSGPVARKRRARADARRILPFITAARKAGCKTLKEVAEALEARGIKTPAANDNWSPEQVRRIEGYGRGGGL